jgi:MFS family permease
LDEAEISRLRWKIMLVSGMGFFTDAYDLFIIGVVMAILKKEWHPTPVETGLVTSTALLASAVGAVLFGRIADLLGRKRIYGVEVLVLAAGAVASALSPNIIWLILFRIILGLGIGGDYPVSAAIMSVIVNLVGVTAADRPGYFATFVNEIHRLATASGPAALACDRRSTSCAS